MLLHPKNLFDKQLYQIDQYVLKGNLCALDPNARAEAASGGQQAVLPVICRDYLRAGVRAGLQAVGDLNTTSVNSRNVLRFPPGYHFCGQLDPASNYKSARAHFC